MQKDEKELLGYYEMLDPAGRQYIMKMANFLAKKSLKEKQKSFSLTLIVGGGVNRQSGADGLHHNIAPVVAQFSVKT